MISVKVTKTSFRPVLRVCTSPLDLRSVPFHHPGGSLSWWGRRAWGGGGGGREGYVHCL